MDEQTIARLNAINRDFYATTASDFDQTRGRAWPGWQRLAPRLNAPLSVLDVGCGNGRFGVFLAETLTGAISYHGIDNNADLLAYARTALSEHAQVSATLTEHDAILGAPPTATYDLVVLFGVIHHVPGRDHRQQMLAQLAQRVRAGGHLCFAAWRFYEYDRFRKRLVDWDDTLTVDAHDYLLDWRRGARALRYCHYVDDAEHEALVAATGLQEVERYRADGADDRMNLYSVLQHPAE